VTTDREAAAPLYIRVAETLKARIEGRIYSPGQLLPPAKALEGEFGVSNITIRKALDRLEAEGLITGRRGVGTRVAQREGDDRVAIEIAGTFRDWLHSASGRAPRLEAEVLEVSQVRGPERVRRVLDPAPEEPLWRMRRVRRLTEGGRREVVSYFVNYGRPGVMDRIDAAEVAATSFVETFQRRSGLRLAYMDQRVEAQVADLDTSAILGIRFGDPIFFAENVYYAPVGGETRPVAVTHFYYRGDRYVYTATISLGGRRGRRKS
jgi:GntR family transcriptional regulator